MREEIYELYALLWLGFERRFYDVWEIHDYYSGLEFLFNPFDYSVNLLLFTGFSQMLFKFSVDLTKVY